jgi:hypothetical protein
MTTPGNYATDTSDMFAVHRALLEALDSAPTLVAGAGSDAERAETVGSFFENVLEFLHVHHSGEDELLYPLLEQRCPDRLAELVEIDDQHKTLFAPMDTGRSAIAAWRVAPSATTAQGVIDALGAIDAALRPHLSDEETTVVPLCSVWISPEEWARLPAHAMQSFRSDKPWLSLGLVFEQLTPAELDGLLAGMPPEMRALWTEQWQPAFESFVTDVRS